MNRKQIMIKVTIVFILGYIVIPLILRYLRFGNEMIGLIRYCSVLPVPILMIKNGSRLPMGDWNLIRIIGICFVVIFTIDFLFVYDDYFASYILGYSLITKMIANFIIFAFSFLVIKYLSISKRGGIFLTITAFLIYLQYSTWFLLIFRVMEDYSLNTYGVNWDVWGWYHSTLFILVLFQFSTQVLALDGLLDEIG